MIKKYLKAYIYLFSGIIILTTLLSIISYLFNLPLSIFKIIIPIISIFISSIILGKNTKEKAYLESLKFSIFYLLLVSIFKIIIHSEFNYKTIIIYISLILSSIIASMLGINLKKD